MFWKQNVRHKDIQGIMCQCGHCFGWIHCFISFMDVFMFKLYYFSLNMSKDDKHLLLLFFLANCVFLSVNKALLKIFQTNSRNHNFLFRQNASRLLSQVIYIFIVFFGNNNYLLLNNISIDYLEYFIETSQTQLNNNSSVCWVKRKKSLEKL